MGGVISLNSKVVGIKKEKDKIVEVIYKKGRKKESIPCDKLVSSMPMKDLIHSMNSVPKKIQEIRENLPYRDFITVGVVVP